VKLKNERIDCILREINGDKILHIGCVGDVTKNEEERLQSMHLQLCQSFPRSEIIGIDTNLSGVQNMKQNGLNVLRGDAENLGYNSQFDVIIAGELIEHLANPGLFLEGCKKGLRIGGRVILSTPNPFSMMSFMMYVKNLNHAFNPDHTLWLCPQTLRQIAERFGFKVIKIIFVDDLRPEIVVSLWYKGFVRAWKLLRILFPKRIRNTIVAVLECNDKNTIGT